MADQYDIDQILREIEERSSSQTFGSSMDDDSSPLLGDSLGISSNKRHTTAFDKNAWEDVMSDTIESSKPTHSKKSAKPDLEKTQRIDLNNVKEKDSQKKKQVAEQLDFGEKFESDQPVVEAVACDDIIGFGQFLCAQRDSLRFQFFLSLFFTVLELYLALASLFSLPVPDIFANNYSIYLWAQVGLVVLNAILCGSSLGQGIVSIFKGISCNYSYVVLAIFASLIQGVYFAFHPTLFMANPSLIYLPIASLFIFFGIIGNLIDNRRKLFACISAKCLGKPACGNAVEVHQPSLMKLLIDKNDEFPTAIAASLNTPRVFDMEPEANSPSKIENISRVVSPIIGLASLALSVLYYFLFNRDLFAACCIFTATLILSSPLGVGLISAFPLFLINRRISKFGCSFVGYHALYGFTLCDAVLIPFSDLFPKDSIVLKNVKIFNKVSPEKTLVQALSVLKAVSSPLCAAFEPVLKNAQLTKVESITSENDGFVAWIGGDRILFGTRSFMSQYKIAIPSDSFEDKYNGDDRKILYISAGGQLCAAFIFKFSVDNNIKKSLKLCEKKGIRIFIQGLNSDVSVSFVEDLYNLPSDVLHLISPDTSKRILSSHLKSDGSPAQLIYKDGLVGYLRSVVFAKPFRNIISIETVFVLLSVIIGFALSAFLAFFGALSTINWTNILLIQFFWFILELIVAVIKR